MSTFKQQEEEKYSMPVNTTTIDAESPPSLNMTDNTIQYDAEEEKRILRKIDMRLIPSVWLMYLLSYLDRSNIGNAYTVSTSIGGKSERQNLMSVF